MNESLPVLQVENLSVAYRTGALWRTVFRDVSLTVEAGQSYGLVGESGSGKTTLAMAIMSYLGVNGVVKGGNVLIDGINLINLGERERRRIWGDKVALVPQNPLSSLNPTLQIGEQIAEILRYHHGLDKPQAATRTLELIHMVRLPDPDRISRSFPHQLSGGMQQRILIAMALSTQPRLLILDEPTTSLDVTTQASILDLIKDLIAGSQTAVLYISHNLGVISRICDRVAVLYAGELVEDASLQAVFTKPLHPYTRGLLDSLPVLGENKRSNLLRIIPGVIPPPGGRPDGCVFAPRCPLAIEICQERPPEFLVDNQRRVRCHRWQEIDNEQIDIYFPNPSYDQETILEPLSSDRPGDNQKNLLKLERIGISFDVGGALRRFDRKNSARELMAVKDVNFSMTRKITLGLVGESGSGKSTLARTILGLVERTAGEMYLYQIPLPARLTDRTLATLQQLQMVFQNPEEALNPHKTIGASLSRPFIRLMNMTNTKAKEEVSRLLEMVKLHVSYAGRMPDQLSGGEKQRIAIARAFAVQPDLLIVDEPVSSLDASLQAFILSLINNLQERYGTALLLISHDLAVVGYLADTIAVMYLGELMEIGSTVQIFQPPYHPYTEALLSSFPVLGPEIDPVHIHLAGDIPSPIDRPSGCPFHPRCPRRLGEVCENQAPTWQTAENGHQIYCHIPLDQLAISQKPVVKKSGE